MTPVLRTSSLTKSFGGVRATSGVDLVVHSGEIRAIIGPNGAGKSTLCNLVSGIYPPTRGDIWFDGERVTGATPRAMSHRGLVRTFQVPRFFGSLTVAENLKLAARLGAAQIKGDRRKARINAILAETGLLGLREDQAAGLSGGQRALLQIGMAIMPIGLKCLLMDEPFAGINPVLKDRIVDMLRRINQERSVTVIVVSHEMDVIRRFCDSISVIANGRCITTGTMEQILADESVVDAYIGSTGAV